MKRLVPLALLGVLFGPLSCYLAARPEPYLSRGLSQDSVALPGQAVDVLTVNGPAAEARVPIWRVGPGDLSSADAVTLLFATYGSTIQVETAQLRIGACLFTLAAPVPLDDNSELRLARGDTCADESSTTAMLSIRASGTGRLAVWTWQMPADGAAPHNGLTLTAPEIGAPLNSVLRGRVEWRFVSRVPRRMSVVGWWWSGIGISPLLVLVSAVVLAGAGMLALARTQTGHVRGAAGAGLVALGLSLTWAVVVPPLQGADEIDHLLSVAEVNHWTEVAPALPAYARQVHFERLRFNTSERFTLPDTLSPYPVAWTGDVHAERMESRSPLAVYLWRFAGSLLPPANPAAQVFGLRLFNALVFALAVALATWFVRWTWEGGAPPAAWALVGIAVIPTLPYFATMVSDWAFVVPLAVLIGAAILGATAGLPRSAWAGLALGTAGALLWGTSIAAIPLVPLVAAVTAGRLVIDRGERGRLLFWAGLGIGLVLAAILLHDLLDVGYQRYDAASRASFAALLGVVNRAARVLADWPFVALPAALLLWMIDLACRPLRTSAGPRAVGAQLVRLAVVAGALVLTVQALWSIVAPLPTLNMMDTTPPNVGAYVRSALVVLLTPARLAGFDHLTFVSLWGGFGWLDALLPAPMLMLITLLILGASAAAAHAAWHGQEIRRLSWLVVIAAGGIASAAAYATAAGLMQRNLHGRYLLPLAVPVAVVVVSWLGTAASRQTRTRWLLAGALALLHGASLWWVAARYV